MLNRKAKRGKWLPCCLRELGQSLSAAYSSKTTVCAGGDERPQMTATTHLVSIDNNPIVEVCTERMDQDAALYVATLAKKVFN